MKYIRNLIVLILCMTVGFAFTAGAEETAQEQTQPYIEQLVISYAAYGERDSEALSGLCSLDPDLGEKWTRIMDLWKTPVQVLTELPDNLPEDDSLCLVALGFQLNPDGTMRDELVERLKVVLASAQKYPRALIVCTGGGTAAEDASATEAGRMAEWLEAQGIDPARVIAEDRSLTTAQNAIYTFDILAGKYPQVRQIAVISSDYHIATGTLLFGAEAILRDSGIEIAGNAAWQAPGGSLSAMFQAGALIELSGDVETAFEIYYETYDIHELPSLQGDGPAPYEHDPRENPTAMRDIVVNPDAVYGFSPSPAEDSTLKDYADMIDWTDPEQVADARAQRQEYHDSMQELYDMILAMMDEDQDIEAIARAVSQRRNELRLEVYRDDPEGLATVKKRNLETYGDENGPTQEWLYEKYGSWEMVLIKALGTNPGMDACLGFYDEYYYVYDLEEEQEPEEESSGGTGKQEKNMNPA